MASHSVFYCAGAGFVVHRFVVVVDHDDDDDEFQLSNTDRRGRHHPHTPLRIW